MKKNTKKKPVPVVGIIVVVSSAVIGMFLTSECLFLTAGFTEKQLLMGRAINSAFIGILIHLLGIGRVLRLDQRKISLIRRVQAGACAGFGLSGLGTTFGTIWMTGITMGGLGGRFWVEHGSFLLLIVAISGTLLYTGIQTLTRQSRQPKAPLYSKPG